MWILRPIAGYTFRDYMNSDIIRVELKINPVNECNKHGRG